jgi:magnesium transporter
MDVYASVISNNMNVVMKLLAVVTIVLSIPNIIFAAYGMNVNGAGMPFASLRGGFWIIIIISLLISVLVAYLFQKRRD